jgi:anti-sigma regulatory factor (Ser/Thr protein kinase)
MAPNLRPVELRLPADAHLIRVARLTVAAVAATLPFTLEEVEDIRIAVDELAALAIDGCGPDRTLVLEVQADGGALSVTGRVAGAGPLPPLHPVAAELIAMVAVDLELGPEGEDRTFRFTKHAEVAIS